MKHDTQAHTYFNKGTSHSCVYVLTYSLQKTHVYIGGGGGRSGLEVVKGAVCYVMEGRNGFALSDRAVTTALFHV